MTIIYDDDDLFKLKNRNNIQKFITKGLFIDSVLEMNVNNNNMINKIKVNKNTKIINSKMCKKII